MSTHNNICFYGELKKIVTKLSSNTLLICSTVLTTVPPLLQDGHEICFVGDEAFRQLSQVDPQADELLDKVNCFAINHLFETDLNI